MTTDETTDPSELSDARVPHVSVPPAAAVPPAADVPSWVADIMGRYDDAEKARADQHREMKTFVEETFSKLYNELERKISDESAARAAGDKDLQAKLGRIEWMRTALPLVALTVSIVTLIVTLALHAPVR